MLLLGGRADTTMIRAGSEVAYLEGTFELSPSMRETLLPVLEPEGLDEGQTVILARELRMNGRNICRVNGRVVTLALFSQVGDHLVDIHGQGEHLSLLRPASHLPLLDSYAGLDNEREALAEQVRQLHKVQQELQRLRNDARDAARRQDMLAFQIQEIQAAGLQPDEEEELRIERTRLANAEKLMAYANEMLRLLQETGTDAPAASDMLNQSERAASQLSRLDESRAAWVARLQGLVSEFDELTADLRDYAESLEFNPERLNYVEERLELISLLKRKYGDSIPAILGYGEKARGELEIISHSEERMTQLDAECERYLQLIGASAVELSEKRQAAAERMANSVENELAELHMVGTRFRVAFRRERQPDGVYVGEERLAFDHTGIDRAEFMISTNPGEPLKPMARVASGGETARLMLALKATLAQIDVTPTLIFDEIDQGIGGRVGGIVGRKLWGLTDNQQHQVVVVTHLPQLAGYGDAHFHVTKQVDHGRTTTHVAVLDQAGRVGELAAMLGTQEHAREGAEAILRQALASKQEAIGAGLVQRTA
jgi:DNA repair protein RecN (Recombination protein N)